MRFLAIRARENSSALRDLIASSCLWIKVSIPIWKLTKKSSSASTKTKWKQEATLTQLLLSFLLYSWSVARTLLQSSASHRKKSHSSSATSFSWCFTMRRLLIQIFSIARVSPRQASFSGYKSTLKCRQRCHSALAKLSSNCRIKASIWTKWLSCTILQFSLSSNCLNARTKKTTSCRCLSQSKWILIGLQFNAPVTPH